MKKREFREPFEKMMLGLDVAGFRINVQLLPGETRWFSQRFLRGVGEMWSSFLCNPFRKPDYTIIVDLKTPVMKMSVKNDEYFVQAWRFEHDRRKAFLSGLQSLWILQMVLRHVLMKLLEGKGFILHASSVIDKQGKVHIFLAPSGGGKSTTAAHLVVQGMSFGTDDSIVFRKKRGGWTCYSSGMVEKTHLPKAFVATKFSLYFLQKSEHLLRAQFPRSIDSMKALMRQLWMLESKVDKETYLLLTEFISQARLYRLSLPLNSPQLSGVLA